MFCGDHEAGGQNGLLAQNGELLYDEPDVTIKVEQLLDLAVGSFAIAAAVVHEFDQRDVAVRIAADEGKTIVEDRLGMIGNQRHISLCLLLGLPLFQRTDGLHDHFGVFHEIGTDLFTEERALRVGHRVQIECERRSAKEGGACQRSN